MVLSFSLPNGFATNYVDISQCASILNRRFYRQGINWAVSEFKVISSSGVNGSMTISRIPHTWVAANAWKKAFEHWNKQQKMALAESGAPNAASKFRDFKIYLDVDHVSAAANLLPIDRQGLLATTGEWEYSQIVIPNAGAPGTNDERYLHMVGVNFNNPGASRGIIEGYADSRPVPTQPDPVSPDMGSTNNWMAQMFDVGDNQSDVLDNATDKNDDLPYPQFDYPGGQTQLATTQYHDSAFVTATTVGGITHMRGGQFYCGLVRLDTNLTIPQDDASILQVVLVPGSHRGYLCEPMGDV
jgi:hypothetical protein